MGLFGESLPFDLPRGDDFRVAWVAERNGHLIHVPNGEIFFAERFFDREISDRALAFLQENDRFDSTPRTWRDLAPEQFDAVRFANIRWKQDHIRVYGKVHSLPRLTAWYGDEDCRYAYSGIASRPNPWNKGLNYLRQRVEACAGVSFNSVLLNWYRDGNDKLDWHADDEPELGVDPVIASVSFGETRDFLLRRNDDHAVKFAVPLGHGALLVMRGELQRFWQHSVPKRVRVGGSRFNLTFRRILTDR